MAKEIQIEDWKLNKTLTDYSPELVRWVKSINKDFRTRIKFEPFELYKKQAKQWLKDEYQFGDCQEYDEQVWWLKREHLRCKYNTLYESDKYGWLKDSENNIAEMKYMAWEAQAIVFYLLDCGFSVIIGKGRQAGLTATIGQYCKKKLNYNKNFFIKFVTHSFDKGTEIFEDKIKFAFGRIPDHLRHKVYNYSEDEISLKEVKEKGRADGMGSRLKVATPSIDAINGGSPHVIAIDEAGLFNEFGQIMREGRPTLFKLDPKTGKQVLTRQLVVWTTGGQVGLGTTAFESEFYAALKDFNEGTFNYGMIPLFLNAYAREGVTEEFLKAEKDRYYAVEGREGEISKVQYHQHYPMTVEDMFLRTSNTLLPMPKINFHIERILNLKEKPQWGYFEPIYDKSKPMDGSGHPYKIKGAQWVPSGDEHSMYSGICIFKHPEEKWKHRYYQGTDPINSESGHSKMASAIWDAQTNTFAAAMNFRTPNLPETFTQCMLLGLYYDPILGCKELVEANIGDSYKDFKERMGYDKNLIAQAALPEYMQINTTKWWGINNKSQTNNKIISKLEELLGGYENNINIHSFWMQMKTFIEKSVVTNNNVSYNAGRISRFQAANLKTDFDDMIFACTYAYIAGICHTRWEPVNLAKEAKQSKKNIKFVQDSRTNWQKRLCEVSPEGKILRFIRG